MSDEAPREGAPESRHTPDSLGGLLRVAAAAGWHTTEWGVRAYLNAGRRALGALTSPTAARDLAEDVRGATREFAATTGLDERVRDATSASDMVQRVASAVPSMGGNREPDAHTRESLRDQGELLMRRSRDVWNEEDAHPAYERILSELAPDEGRILLLLHGKGPQPSVDVRTGGPIGLLNSRLIAPGLTMIGGRAGLRYPENVPAYLNNLFRLGMVWFSRETLPDPLPYQVVEAQPNVLAAMKSVRFPKVVRRSIHLTPFGEDFCHQALAAENPPGTEPPVDGTPPAPEDAKEPEPTEEPAHDEAGGDSATSDG